MVWCVILGFLAAFGLLCALWVLFGLILPCKTNCQTAVVCCDGQALAVIRRFCRMRQMGLTRSELTVLDSALTNHQQQLIQKRYPYIRFCTRQAWLSGEDRECLRFGSGDGDPAGYHRCGGVPEL